MFSVRLADLSAMTEADRSRSLTELASAARTPNGGLARVSAAIAEFEREHGMTSEVMALRLARGELTETLEICDWSRALRKRELLSDLAQAHQS